MYSSLTQQFTVGSASYSVTKDVLLLIQKRRENVLYKSNVTTDDILISKMLGQEFTAANNLSLIDRSTEVFEENRLPDALAFKKEDSVTSITTTSNRIYITDVYVTGNTVTKTTPLFYKHIIDSDHFTASTDIILNVKILDHNLQEILYNEKSVDSTNGIIYNNISATYSNVDGSYTAYYFRYTIKNSSNELNTYTVLVNNQKVFELATIDNIDAYGALINDGSKVYLEEENFDGTYTYNFPTSLDISYRIEDNNKIQLLPPNNQDIGDVWQVKIKDGKFFSTVNNTTYKYHIPEVLTQSFTPYYPYKYTIKESGTVLNKTLIKTGYNRIKVSDTLNFHMDMFLYDTDGTTLLYAFTTDSTKHGTSYTDAFDNTKSFVNYESYADELGIRSVDGFNGFIDIVGVDLKSSYYVYLTYYYEVEDYVFTTNFNPILNQDIVGTYTVLFMIPDTTVSSRTQNIYYLTVNKDGKVIASDWSSFDNTTQKLTSGKDLFIDTAPTWYTDLYGTRDYINFTDTFASLNTTYYLTGDKWAFEGSTTSLRLINGSSSSTLEPAPADGSTSGMCKYGSQSFFINKGGTNYLTSDGSTCENFPTGFTVAMMTGTATADTSNYWQGSQSIKISNTGFFDEVSTITTDSRANWGFSIVASVYLKGTVAGKNVTFYCRDDSDGSYANKITTFTLTTEWKRYYMIVPTLYKAGGYKLKFGFFNFGGDADAVFYMDGLQIDAYQSGTDIMTKWVEGGTSGSSENFSITDLSTINPNSETEQDLSISFWTNGPFHTGSFYPLFDLIDSGGSNEIKIEAKDDTTDVLKVTTTTSLGSTTASYSAAGIWDNDFHLVNLIYRYAPSASENNIELYFDGSLVASDNSGDYCPTFTFDTLYIGNDGTTYFNGNIDDLVILPYAEDSAWVTSIYTDTAAFNDFGYYSSFTAPLVESDTKLIGSTINNLTSFTGYYFIIGEVHIGNKYGVQNISEYDIRAEGGGLKEDSIWNSRIVNPALWDVASWDGIPFPGQGAALIEIPVEVMSGAGGNFEASKIKEIAERHIAYGFYPAIRAYGIDPRITSVEFTSSGVELTWTHHAATTYYDVYYTLNRDSTPTKATSSPQLENASGNTFTISGLTAGATYYFFVVGGTLNDGGTLDALCEQEVGPKNEEALNVNTTEYFKVEIPESTTIAEIP